MIKLCKKLAGLLIMMNLALVLFGCTTMTSVSGVNNLASIDPASRQTWNSAYYSGKANSGTQSYFYNSNYRNAEYEKQRVEEEGWAYDLSRVFLPVVIVEGIFLSVQSFLAFGLANRQIKKEEGKKSGVGLAMVLKKYQLLAIIPGVVILLWCKGRLEENVRNSKRNKYAILSLIFGLIGGVTILSLTIGYRLFSPTAVSPFPFLTTIVLSWPSALMVLLAPIISIVTGVLGLKSKQAEISMAGFLFGIAALIAPLVIYVLYVIAFIAYHF